MSEYGGSLSPARQAPRRVKRQRGGGSSRSPSPAGRLRAFSPSRSADDASGAGRRAGADREASPLQQAGRRRRRHRAVAEPPVDDRSGSAGDGSRRRNHRSDELQLRPTDGARDRGGDRDRRREKDREKARRRAEKQQRGYMNMMAAQQNPAMRMAMMQGMMGMANPAMQMAMMQQMSYVQAMQAAGRMPPGMPPFGMFQPPPPPPQPKKKRRRKEGASGSSSSSESGSKDSSDAGLTKGVPSGSMAVEAFLAQCPVDPEAADRLRALPPHLQQAVMARGSVADSRNPAAVLISRIRDAQLGQAGSEPMLGDLGEGVDGDGGKLAMRRSAKSTIEDMISEYRLSPGCAWMLRALPPDRQKLAAKIDPSGQADPSGYVAEMLKTIV